MFPSTQWASLSLPSHCVPGPEWGVEFPFYLFPIMNPNDHECPFTLVRVCKTVLWSTEMIFCMPAFPYFSMRTSDGPNYLHKGWGKKKQKKSHMNKFIFKREIYIEDAILEKGIKDNNPANRERGSQSYRLDFGLNRCWLTNIQKKNRCCMPGLRVHQLIAQPVLLAKPLAALSDTSLPRYSLTLSFVESLELWSLCSQSNWSFCLGRKCVTGQIWMLLLRLCKLSSCSFLPLKLD